MEQEGISTLTISVAHDITESVRPPRAAFINYPMGNTVGPPNGKAVQLRILRALFAAAPRIEPGVICDLGFALEARGPDGRPWQEWVYTKEFRRKHMKKRDGSSWRDE